MEKINPGQQLEQICSSAKYELWLVAPFVKLLTLTQLLEKVQSNVALNCVTRWRPEEIIAGVSDLEVWLLLRNRPLSSLWLRHDLHAKYYRADDHCLVGSANLTQTALGWSTHPNLELLIPASADNPILQLFEQELNYKSIQVDDNLYEQMRSTVEKLRQSHPDLVWTYPDQELNLFVDEIPRTLDSQRWIPTLRTPDNLFLAYTGQKDRLTAASWESAQRDLMAFDVPTYLTKATFNAYVGSLLLQMPIIQCVDEMLRTPQRFGSMSQLLKGLPCAEDPEFDADRAWQTLMRWLRYFLPNRYGLSVPNYSEVFYRVDRNTESLRVAEQGAAEYES